MSETRCACGHGPEQHNYNHGCATCGGACKPASEGAAGRDDEWCRRTLEYIDNGKSYGNTQAIIKAFAALRAEVELVTKRHNECHDEIEKQQAANARLRAALREIEKRECDRLHARVARRAIEEGK